MFSIASSSVQAHPPANMTLAYDADAATLTVTVFHAVADVNTHYIVRIEIAKNGTSYTSRDYTSQENPSFMDDVFNVNATTGDILQATAYCSILGSITMQLTVGGTGTTTPTIPGFPLLAVALGIAVGAALSVVAHRRRKA
jgi:desulfoferrodoxin (superoxide reductase-like protein)